MVRKLFRILLVMAVCAAVIVIAYGVYGWSGGTGKEVRHMFSEEEASREILFDGNHVFTTKDSFVQINDKVVTITRSGTYMLKGSMDDGQIVINVGKEEEVKLKLNGLTISCSFGPPIYVKEAKKVRIRLKAGSENVFTDGIGEDNAGDTENAENLLSDDSWRGCIYARSDLNIKGDGELIIHGNHRHGIFCSKDLKIKSGTVTVDAARQALHGKKSVTIEDGIISLKAGTDGIHSNGTLDITGGTIDIDAGKYGLYAFSSLHVKRAPGEVKKTGSEADEGTDDSAAKNSEAGARVTVINALSEAGCQGEMEY